MTDLVTLRPFECGRCGAPLALGQAAVSRCAHCTEVTAIPPEYKAAQRQAKSFAEDQKLAHQLYGKIGKPPSRLAMLVGGGFDRTSRLGAIAGQVILLVAFFPGGLGLLAIAAAAYVLAYPVAKVFRFAFVLAGAPIREPLPAWFVFLLTLLVLVPFVGVPTIWYRREREIAEARRSVHASLAARLPERPGGASLCHRCGAALEIPPGALGVPCVYCKADNLVALPGAWVSQIRAGEFRRFLRIDGALEAFRLASERARERAWATALWSVLVVPLLLVLGWILNGVTF